MLHYPEFDPIALHLGPLQVHWYGLMYLLAFATAWWLAIIKARQTNSGWAVQEVGDLVFYAALGVILGGRLGYALFYQPGQYLASPTAILAIWKGGMSFHGGLIGVAVALWLYARKTKRSILDVGDFVAPLVAPGLGFGRIGNFINQELWGRATDLPWGMVFPLAGPQPRHPSQLYEALLEGLVLFVLVWLFALRPRPRGVVLGLFLLGYGIFRFAVEFAREPDSFLGFVAFSWMSMGQVLSIPLIILGLYFVFRKH